MLFGKRTNFVTYQKTQGTEWQRELWNSTIFYLVNELIQSIIREIQNYIYSQNILNFPALGKIKGGNFKNISVVIQLLLLYMYHGVLMHRKIQCTILLLSFGLGANRIFFLAQILKYGVVLLLKYMFLKRFSVLPINNFTPMILFFQNSEEYEETYSNSY